MHSHASHHHPHSGSSKTLLLATLLTLGFAAIEASVGLLAGSLALVADAGHMVNDAAALALAAGAAWLAGRRTSSRHSYGLGRVEFLAALINSLALLALVGWISLSAIERLRTPQPVSGEAVLLTATIGLGINLLVMWILSRGEKNLNTRAARLHVIGDLLGSVAAILSGLVIALTGWTPIDPLLSLFIGVLILYSSLRLLREVVHGLMEGAPFDIDPEAVGRALADIPGVASVHDLHIWQVKAGKTLLTAHLVVENIAHWEQVMEKSHTLLAERFDIQHATLQPEPITRTVHWAPIRQDEHPHER